MYAGLPSKWTRLVIGLLNWELFVRIAALRTKPSRPSLVSSTMPKGCSPLGIGSSTMSTKSPTSVLGFTWNHFCRDCKSGKYSCAHLFQNWAAMYCTYRHHFWYASAVSKLPHGNEATPCIANRWFGVKPPSHLTSSLYLVIGRPLMMHSHSQSMVWRTSSVSVMWGRNSAKQYLANSSYESLPHTTMVGSKGRVEISVNTSAPDSRPNLSLVQLKKTPGYLCLCIDEIRPIVTVDLGRAPTPGNKEDEAIYEGLGLQAAENLNLIGLGLETRQYTTPSLDLPAFDLNQYWATQVSSHDIKGSLSCHTPLEWEISHPLIKWCSLKTFANQTLSPNLLHQVSCPQL